MRLRLGVWPDAFGNALGSSIADSFGQSSGSSTGIGEDVLGDFIVKNQATWNRNELTAAAYDQLADVFGQAVGRPVDRSRDVSMVDASAYTGEERPPVRVEVAGTDWRTYKEMPTLPDGTPVLEHIDPSNGRLMVEKPIGDYNELPSIPGYGIAGVDVSRSTGTQQIFYARGLAPDQGIDPFFSPDAIAAQDATNANAAEAASSFQVINDQKVMAGTYSRFSEIGGAISDGRYGDAWRHVTFTASAQEQAAVKQRLFPPPSADVQRLSTMTASPAGSIAWGLARFAGASPQTQDALLQTVAAAGHVAGSVTGYKQALTAQAPQPLSASRVRSGMPVTPNGKTASDNEIFTGRTTWAAPSQGTGYRYKVYQQQIDWTLEVKGITNLQRAQVGQAPYVLKNGKLEQVQLHYSRQNAQGPLFELTRGTHLETKSGQGREALHPYGNQKHPDYPVDRALFGKDVRQYWIDRAAGAK